MMTVQLVMMIGISIHAPVKGATSQDKSFLSTSCISIHAPVKGATLVMVTTDTVRRIFQSTHP